MGSIVEHTVTTFSEDQCTLLMTESMMKYVDQSCDDKTGGEWEVMTQPLMMKIYCEDDSSLERTKNMLMSRLVQEKLVLSEGMLSFVETPLYKEFIDKLLQERDNRAVISTVDRTIVITTTPDDRNHFKKEISMFLQSYSICTHSVELPAPLVKFIRLHFQKNLSAIEELVYSVKFTIVGDKIDIEGCEVGIQTARVELEKLTNCIKKYTRRIDHAGVYGFLKNAEDVEQLERESRCVLVVQNISLSQVKEVSIYGLGKQRRLHVIQGRIEAIEDLNVDAIVVEVDDNLRPTSSQASSIFNKVGDWTSLKNPSMPIGPHIVPVSGDDLPCKKKILLAVANISINNPRTTIISIVTASLHAAADSGMSSLMFPAFNVRSITESMNPAEVNRCVREATQTFFRDYDVAQIDEVYMWIEDIQSNDVTMLDEGRQQEVDTQQEIYVRSSASLTPSLPRQPLSAKVTIPTDVDFSKPRILLVQADMGVEEADVIVNSTNKRLHLNIGMVSSSLLKHAGPLLQKECKEKYRHGIDFGDIAITTGGDMQCVEHIYHCVLPKWTSNSGEKTLVRTLQSLMLKAHKEGWKTMALPALGTGRLGYDRALVARVMYQTILQFGKDNPNTTISDVLVIVYPGDVECCQVFEAEHKKYVESNGGSVPTSAQERRTVDEAALVSFREAQKVNKESRGSLVKPSVGASLKVVKEFFASHNATGAHEEHLERPQPTPVSNKVSVSIYTDCVQQADSVVDRILKILHRKTEKRVINESSLGSWNNDQKDRLLGLQSDCHVHIQLDIVRGKVIVEGLSDHILYAITSIQQMCLSLQRETDERDKAEALANSVQWYVIDVDGKEIPYPVLVNSKLEKAFINDPNKSFEYKFVGYDLKSMVEFPVNDTQDRLVIVRKDLLQDARVPSTWKTGSGLVAVLKETVEYKSVEQNLMKGFPPNSPPTLVSVERIQNRTLYAQYKAKLDQLKVEQILWYETKQENIQTIVKDGFNRSHCSSDEQNLGVGVYFHKVAPGATNSTKLPVDSDGHRYLFQTKVLTGRYTKGDPTLNVPPLRDTDNTLRYDSVVNDINNPSIFVIFNETQAYPEYILKITSSRDKVPRKVPRKTP